MNRIRVSLVIAMLTLLVTTPVWAVGDVDIWPEEWAPKKLDLPPIRIVNDANHTWSVKVWAYPGTATTWQSYSCQTLDYDFGWARHIEPIKVDFPLRTLTHDHCGNYETLTFWFRAWNRETGAYRDISTFGTPAPWGATWTFDGMNWICTGCE